MKLLGEPLGNTTRAIWDTTDGYPPSFGTASISIARYETPMKKVIARTPRMPSVRAALRAWGRRNALTPLAIASTPVRAVDPEAKARMSTKSPIAPTPTGIGSGATVGPHSPSAQRAAPARTSASIETMNA